MLEPNNFIPSWEAGDEEKKEVSHTLRKLRIKYDNINKMVREKERELEELKVTVSHHSSYCRKSSNRRVRKNSKSRMLSSARLTTSQVPRENWA